MLHDVLEAEARERGEEGRGREKMMTPSYRRGMSWPFRKSSGDHDASHEEGVELYGGGDDSAYTFLPCLCFVGATGTSVLCRSAWGDGEMVRF